MDGVFLSFSNSQMSKWLRLEILSVTNDLISYFEQNISNKFIPNPELCPHYMNHSKVMIHLKNLELMEGIGAPHRRTNLFHSNHIIWFVKVHSTTLDMWDTG